MRQLIRRAMEKWRKGGSIVLVRSTVSFVLERYPKFVAGYTVMALDRLGRIVRADEISQDEYQYASAERLQVGIEGGDPHPFLRNHVGEMVSDTQSVRILDNVRLVGPHGIVITSEGEVVLDSTCNRRYMLRSTIEHTIKDCGLIETGRLLIKGFTGFGVPRRDTNGRHAISMLNRQADNYFHWAVEHLPRLRSIDVIDGFAEGDVEILVQSDAPPFVEDSLLVLQYPNVANWGDDVQRLESLIVPDHRLRSRDEDFMVSPSDLRWLRSRAKACVDEQEPPEPEALIYISRVDADVRNVVNRDELLAAIGPLGFTEYALSESTLEEQIRLFRHAEVILAPHGAGLANVVYAEDATVIELYAEDIRQGQYFMLVANELGHEYNSITCGTADDHLVAPIEEVVRFLQARQEDQ